jgi:hypothetical protein
MSKKDDELMQQAQRIKDGWRFHFRFLVRKEEDWFVAYCLELDLMTAAKTEDQAVQDIVDVTIEQVRYCIVNDNIDRLFRRAPEEIWNEYYACEKNPNQKPRIIKAPSKEALADDLPPFSFIASACRSQNFCHAH